MNARVIDGLLRHAGVDAWGVAGNEPALPLAPSLPTAISLLMRLTAEELAGVEDGPTAAYLAGYRRLSSGLEAAATGLISASRAAGHAAEHVQPTVPEELWDEVLDWGDAGVFPHKTAATRAGLGWIGKTALLVSPDFGPRVRLAAVFTDLALPAGTPTDAGRCGDCTRCVDACPAGAGRDVTWVAGMPRERLYDEKACERQTDSYREVFARSRPDYPDVQVIGFWLVG